MSRNFANIVTAIWRDKDFVALRSDAQRMYLLMCTQADISACGLLHLRTRRWSKLAADTTPHDIEASLKELEAAQLIVADEDTEEVLVRSFTRHDNGHANPRRQPSIRDAADAIESPTIVAALSVEFDRLGLAAQWRGQAKSISSSTECLSDRHSEGIPETRVDHSEPPPGAPKGPSGGGAPAPTVEDPPSATKPQVNSHSDSHSGRLPDSQTRIDGMANRFQTARTTTHNPQPVSELRSSTARTRDDEKRPEPNKAIALMVGAVGATAEEARTLLDHLHNLHDIRNEFAFVRTMAAEGGLRELLAELRAAVQADFDRRFHRFDPYSDGACKHCPFPKDHRCHSHALHLVEAIA